MTEKAVVQMDGDPGLRRDDTGHGGKERGEVLGFGCEDTASLLITPALTPTLILFYTMPCHPGEGRDRHPTYRAHFCRPESRDRPPYSLHPIP